MKRILAVLAVAVLGASSAGVAAQNSKSVQVAANENNGTSALVSANAGKANGPLSSGTKIIATLATPLDAKKNKPGDRVEAWTAQDVKRDGKIVVLKSGTSLIGRVTVVQARTKEQTESRMVVVFDYAVMKNGEQMPLNLSIQGLAAPIPSTAGTDSSALASAATDSSGGTGLPAAFGSSFGEICDSTRVVTLAVESSHDAEAVALSSAGATYNLGGSAAKNATGAVDDVDRSSEVVAGRTSPLAPLASKSSSAPATSSAAKGSLLVSSTKNVHLDRGTQMLLNVNAAPNSRS